MTGVQTCALPIFERLAEREARLWTDAQRVAAADDVIDNSGTTEQLQRAVDDYIDRYAGS